MLLRCLFCWVRASHDELAGSLQQSLVLQPQKGMTAGKPQLVYNNNIRQPGDKCCPAFM